MLNFRLPLALMCAVILILTACSAEEAKPSNWQNTLIVDVRTQAEWQSGHLDGAIHIPWEQIADGLEQQDVNKDQAIALYCRSGNRAGKAMKILTDLGYTNVQNLNSIQYAAHITGRSIKK